jgi:4-amino-4-deoxy-L-arabinose transferase-like glycosyltransferase
MVESGDWVTPRLYGKPWFEKPALYYWGAAITFKLFGVNEAAARLPSAICALLATLALAWLAWGIYGAEIARFLCVMLPVTIAMTGFSHAAAPDMPFASMLTLAMTVAVVVVGRAKTREASASPAPLGALVMFGFFLGAACLAKGPAAIILAGGATGLWALATKRWRDAFRLAHPIAILAFCATALPWYALCARRNPDFLPVFILEHNFARFLTPVFQHGQPFWFFVPVVLLGVLPWTAVFAVLGRDTLRSLRAGTPLQSPLWFVGCFAVIPVIFFSLSKSKLPGYVLPSFPPLALLFARSLGHAEFGTRRRGKWLTFVQAAMFVALGIAARMFQGRVVDGTDLAPVPWKIEFIGAVLGGGIVIACLGLWKRASLGVLPSVVLTLVLVGILGHGLADLDPIYFSRDVTKLAFTVYPALAPQNVFVYRVQRAQHYSLNFYLHRELPEWTREQKDPGWVFTPMKEQAALEGSGLKCNARQHLATTSLIVCAQP